MFGEAGERMQKRETELDILRLMALLGVVFTHGCGIEIHSNISRCVMTFLIATVTWHVPAFVMISGRFFLDPQREISGKKLLQAIGHLALSFAFWNLLYQIYFVATNVYTGLNWKGILSQGLQGVYHFWYLFMLVCLYAVTPFLRKIAENKKLSEYFLVLFFAFSFLNGYGHRLPLIGATVEQIVVKTNFHFAVGYSGYYILGWYLRRWPLSGKKETGLYLAGILMLLLTGGATVWKTLRGAPGEEWFSKYLLPNVILEAAAIYTFFVNRVSRLKIPEKVASFVSETAKCSFGAYLIHAFVLELAGIVSWEAVAVNPVLVVWIRVVLVFAVSLGLSALIRKIPVVGRKIT